MRPRRMLFPALRVAAASAAALGLIGLAGVADAQIVPPTASVPACHTFDALGQPATLFAPGDKIIVKGEGFGLVTPIGITFVQQSKTTTLGQAYSSELGVFSTDRTNPVIPPTSAPGPAQVHAFSSTRVATCAVQVMAAAAAAPKKKSGSSGFIAIWGALLLVFGLVLAVVGLRRWRAGRLQTAVERTSHVVEAPELQKRPITTAAQPHDDFELPPLEPVEAQPVEAPEPVDEAPHSPASLAEIAAPPLPEDSSDHPSRTLADLAAPPLPAEEESEHSARSLADLAAPPPEQEEDLDSSPAHVDEPGRAWPARPPLERDEIRTAGVYWPPEELEDTDDDEYFLEPDHGPGRDAPTERPEQTDDIPEDLLDPPAPNTQSRVDFADASEVADAMHVPMPGADHTHPPILDADPSGEWPAWNGRVQQAHDEPADDDTGETDPVVVEGDMSDTVARLVEDTKGWNKG